MLERSTFTPDGPEMESEDSYTPMPQPASPPVPLSPEPPSGPQEKPVATKLTPQQVLLEIIHNTAGRDPSTDEIATVREILRANPYLWRFAGSPERIVAARMLKKSSMNSFAREATRAGLSELLEQLEYSRSHPIVCLAIDQVVLRWLQLAIADHDYESLRDSRARRSELAAAEKRVTAAHKRFVHSLDSLARMKRAARYFKPNPDTRSPDQLTRENALRRQFGHALNDNDWSAVFALADSEPSPARSLPSIDAELALTPALPADAEIAPEPQLSPDGEPTPEK